MTTATYTVSADTLRRQQQRRWTEKEQTKLEDMLDRGMSYRAIAKALGRTRFSVTTRCDRIGLCKTKSYHTPMTISRLFQIRNSQNVYRWIERGWLRAVNVSDGAQSCWRICLEDIWQFMENRDTWMAWSAESITEPDLRAWAIQLRANGPVWLSCEDAARRLCISPARVRIYARRGWLTTVAYGNRGHRWFREDEVAAFVVPSDRDPEPVTCPDCGQVIRSRKGLAPHRRTHKEPTT